MNNKSQLLSKFCKNLVVVVLPDPFRRIGAWRNSMETQQSDHTLKSGSEVINRRSSAKDARRSDLDAGQSRRW